jgi:hypothetical protein
MSQCVLKLEGGDRYAEADALANECMSRLVDGLKHEDRVFFLMNKWFAVDEYAAVILRGALNRDQRPRDGSTPSWWQSRRERATRRRDLEHT